ncbi:transposase IS4 family protein [[Leptolyngbya] sp. PCC 7376]|uniref:IS982 family transposase n=1 Tax=[Leptolyngbya] sp. PCC 7376 TaxID=111781 RepID=UPI00029F34F5|nr:IS982 family transposase [[Leptolyngbya] sp. PCC 7376]AFY37022.1 transposase IS4 family protein [[Leptolyngbya] sp. PCC 7376]AFY37331.1 transposase IS4 family protein [[Leptolyngbya] sp. PCC 7376]AFY38376.1 transposase IS4 family protein [[Leptolyngbya] sp. PCC 7376]
MSSLEALFCHVDDFCQVFEPLWHQALLSSGKKYRRRQRSLSLSEVMTILIAFHQSHYRNFKHFYLIKVKCDWQQEFPLAVSYQRFVTWILSSLIPLCTYLRRCFGQYTGISFIDATSIKVCHNRRISQHRVFEGCAARGKTSVGWFFGFKLHLVINERGELLNVQVTPGNTDDRQPIVELWQDLWGKVFADKGYVSQSLAQHLQEEHEVTLMAKPRRNMKHHLMVYQNKLFARKRALIETVIDQLKNISQIEHSRHRSPTNFCVNLLCGLIAYCHQPKKPSLQLD